MTSDRRREGGQPATRLIDFLNHVHGVADRHTADQLDMAPPLTSAMGALSDPTVQGTLEKIGTYLTSIGTGFISIGEGYDVVAADFNVGAAGTPSLSSAFVAAFAHPRLVNGGIILVKAGTYYLSSTVSVPAGIMIMGELGGTIINGLTVEQPMFIIKRALDHAHLTASGLLATDPIDKTQFFNIVLTDGYVNASFSPLMTTVPMIRVETGAYFTCEQVTFLGKMGTLGAGPGYGRSKTLYAIGYTSVGSEETTTILERCVFDGMRSIINFAPGSATDKLTINNCKARVFGSESAADIGDPTKNCFVLVGGTSFVKITNNYFNPGIRNGTTGQSYVTSMATHTSGNPSFLITGNTGTIAFEMTAEETLVNDNGTGNTVYVSSAGNLWNNQNFSNQWFLTVGDGVYSVGDVTGTTALNTVMAYILSETPPLSEIYVNFGFYTYSSSVALNSDFVLIGKKFPDGTRPQITLNVGAADVDYLGNRYITVGSRIEHLSFVSTARHQSVYMMRSTLKGQVYANDCQFTDTSLVVEKLNTDVAFVDINNCHFISTGAFANNLQLLAPPSHSTRVTGCLFEGSDYAMAIGEFSSIGYTNVYAGTGPKEIIINNVSFELNASAAITGNSPAGTNRYIIISDLTSIVELNNIIVTAGASQIDASMLDFFEKWIEIVGYGIQINNSVFNGINQLTHGSANVIPHLFITPILWFNINKTLIQSALPLQVSGTLAFLTSTTGSNGIFIKDCQIVAYENNATSTTVLDIDVSLGSLGTIQQNGGLPIIDISGNIFSNKSTGAVTKAASHLFGDIFHCGCVQIFAHGFDIHVHDNNILAGTQVTSIATGVAGLLINAYTAATGTDGSVYSKVNVSDNTIYAINYYTTGGAAEVSAAMWINSSYLNIANNTLTMVGPASSNNVCALYVQNTPTNNGTFFGALSSGIVTGNSFNRLASNSSSVLTGGYVIIEATSGRGTLVDNEFDARTLNGSDTALVSNTGTPWNISRNKNQTATIDLGFATALHSLYTNDSIPTCINLDNTSTQSSISVSAATVVPLPDTFIIFICSDLSIDMFFHVVWGLNSVLPKDVKIVSCTTAYQSITGTFSTTGDLSLNVSSQNTSGPDGGIFSANADLTSSTTGPLTATALNPEDFNTSTDNPVVYLHLKGNSSNIEQLRVNIITLTYYW